MRCPRCQFENLPGQASCFRCGSLLEAKAGAVEVHPPRAPAWKKPFRLIARRMRHYSAARRAERLANRAATRTTAAAFKITGLPGLPPSGGALQWRELWDALRDAAVALALSIVPGLAQALRHEFRTIYLYVISWFVSLALGILCLGNSFGSACMASAFVLHAWIAMDAVVGTKRFKEKMTAAARMGWRLVGIAFGVLLLYVAYVHIRNATGLTIAFSGVTVPAHQVERGDSILCRFLPAGRTPPLKRGDLVLVRVYTLYAAPHGEQLPGRQRRVGNYVGDQVGQLIALPGDELRLRPEGFTVNGRALDAREFPVQSSLRGQSASLTLGNGEYFVTMVWVGTWLGEGGHGVAGGQDVAHAPGAQVDAANCVLHREDVLGRGVMRWWPLRKRGFLKELE